MSPNVFLGTHMKGLHTWAPPRDFYGILMELQGARVFNKDIPRVPIGNTRGHLCLHIRTQYTHV